MLLNSKHSEETKRKMSFLAKKYGPFGCAVKGIMKPKGFGKKMSELQKGKVFTDEHKKNLKLARQKQIRPKGQDCWNWKGGITSERIKIWHSLEYKIWRKSVFERDNYTCQECKEVGKELNAHHIIPFSVFHKGRFEINNGKTLCKNCHQKTNTFGGRVTNNKKYLIIKVDNKVT